MIYFIPKYDIHISIVHTYSTLFIYLVIHIIQYTENRMQELWDLGNYVTLVGYWWVFGAPLQRSSKIRSLLCPRFHSSMIFFLLNSDLIKTL